MALRNHALKPACSLLRIGHAVEQHERINVTLPATSERKIDFGNLSGHHPESEDVVAVWSKPKTAVLLWNCGSVQAGAEKIFKVLGWKCGRAVILGRPRRKLLAGQRADAIYKFPLSDFKIELAESVS